MYIPSHIGYSLSIHAHPLTSELTIQMRNNLIFIGLLFSRIV